MIYCLLVVPFHGRPGGERRYCGEGGSANSLPDRAWGTWRHCLEIYIYKEYKMFFLNIYLNLVSLSFSLQMSFQSILPPVDELLLLDRQKE